MTFTKNEETYRETRATDEMVVGEQVTLSTLVILIRKMCVSSDFGKSIPQESSPLHICYRSLGLSPERAIDRRPDSSHTWQVSAKRSAGDPDHFISMPVCSAFRRCGHHRFEFFRFQLCAIEATVSRYTFGSAR